MELIYTAQKSGFDPDKRYRNPEHFDRAESGVKSVVIVGEWPKVVAAYEEVGVEVSIVELPKAAPQKALVVGGLNSAVSEALATELASIGIIVESFAEQRLERPEGALGETAGRLLQVLEAVNAGVASLQRERDGEVEKVQILQRKLDELVSQTAQGRQVPDEEREAKEVAELKARLDAAGVTYRVNASKESLEKLVSELPAA
ncbi:hypothetical protein [Pseudomonas sp. R16(2017)]|uniref:hypothetical protein n=1 Tax=Pseudomonas sp. R16(2017) TaxID=1981704 RepID=UPI000A1EAE55|nr:hypothetical protein [Pseudomonas sp. R16(2017)]